MTDEATAYLVLRHQDGYGDVFALRAGERLTLGRAGTNRIVLKDELCSREHAELFFAEGAWQVKDLSSLNGTRIHACEDPDGGDEPLEKEWKLAVGDEIHVGHSQLVFVEDMSQLPHVPEAPPRELVDESEDGVSIKQRLGQTRFLTPQPSASEKNGEEQTSPQQSLSRALSLLYRLALDMGSATSYEDLANIVLNGLLEAIPADVGAILELTTGRELELVAYRHRDPSISTYHKVSDFVSNDVLSARQAVLAEDVAKDDHLQKRESLNDIGASSLICAPVIFGEKVEGLIHLYCTNPVKSLTTDDLEFTMAVAKKLGTATHRIRQHDSLAAENEALRNQLRVESELVGNSPGIEQVESQIGRVAATNATVLIRGESGSGKELVARAIHYSSHRKHGPFICLNCAAITETLLESELFGHEKGSFTGATEKKIGKFEAAHGGTIFLDEIGEMSVMTQAKLLRILEGHTFERVGGGTPIRADVRVVSATNQPLEENIENGRFRRDLFYRLQVVEIQLPPLRERRDDVPLLAEHFLGRFITETGRRITGFTDAALTAMQQYDWPGNVRELRNVVERAVALGKGPQLDVQDIWLPTQTNRSLLATDGAEVVYEPVSISEMEKIHIEKTLQYTDWNKSQAAGILGIERSTLDRKIKGYEIKRL